MIVLGDESGYAVTEAQQTKLAAMEGDVEDRARAGIVHPVRDPRRGQKRENDWPRSKIPYVLGLIATRSANKEIPGIDELEAHGSRAHQERHR